MSRKMDATTEAPAALAETDLDAAVGGAITYGDFDGATVMYTDVTEDANSKPTRPGALRS